MNILYLCILSSCLSITAKKVSIHRLDEKSVNNHWKSFKVKHNKFYHNGTHHERRKQIFINNLKTINEHNDKFNNGTVYHSLALNQFGDWVNMSKNKYINNKNVNFNNE
jgi:hypothetical protein